MKLPKSSCLCRYESSVVQSISPRSAYFISTKSLLAHVLCHLPWFSAQQAAYYTAVSILYSSTYIHMHLQVHMNYRERERNLPLCHIILFALRVRSLQCNTFYNFQWMHDWHSHKSQEQTQKFSQLQNITLILSGEGQQVPSYVRSLWCGVGKNREKRKAHVLPM